MATKIKICGLTRPCDIEAVNSTKPDYIGFVFANSRRKVTPQQASKLRDKLNASIIPVGVFVNESIENIIPIVRDGIIEMIQLHGSENEDYIQELKQLTEKLIIKSITVRHKGDVRAWSNTAADYLLLDNANGGTGQTFDWNLIDSTEKLFFLAGGLNAENITEAIAKTSPFAVDVSSGVETNGLKNLTKINEFIRRVRNG